MIDLQNFKFLVFIFTSKQQQDRPPSTQGYLRNQSGYVMARLGQEVKRGGGGEQVQGDEDGGEDKGGLVQGSGGRGCWQQPHSDRMNSSLDLNSWPLFSDCRASISS